MNTRKIIFALIALLSLQVTASAQSYEKALGIRGGIGTASYYGAEITYQNWVSDHNRVEYDLGLNFGGLEDGVNWVSLAAIYQWHWTIEDGFGWYAGPGAMASLSFDNPKFGIGVGGQIGIDYQFDIPLQLSLDIRPIWNFIGYVSGFNWGTSLGIRYAF